MIHFRTVTGKMFDLQMQPSETIADAKNYISNEEGFDCQKCVFLYGPKILKDTDKFEDIDIKPSQYIIMHTEEKPELNFQKGIAPSFQSVSSGGIGLDPPDFESNVSSLMDMGFSRSQSEAALRNQKYNIEKALNMLLNTPDPSNLTPNDNYDNGWAMQAMDSTDVVDNQNIQQSDGNQYPIPDSFTALEKAAIQRLFSKFPQMDKDAIIDIYNDSNKNESLVEELLS